MTHERGFVDRAEYLSGLEARHIRMDAREAESLAAELYGEVVVATRLDAEKDDTFRLDGPAGPRLIMKVANPVEPADEIAFQLALLAHVADRDPELTVPAVVPDRLGRRWVEIIDAAGQARIVMLLTFVDGITFDTVPSSVALRHHTGQVLGRLRHAMVGFEHVSGSRVVAWDVRHLLRLAPGVDALSDATHRAELRRGLERFAAVEPAVQRLRRQVVHNDFSKSNLIVDRYRRDRLAGVIDFGDAVSTAIAIDVSTALLNQLPRDLERGADGDMFAEGRDLLAGYLEVADLTDEELTLLPYLVMGRVIARAIITHNRARLFPDNAAYIMRNTEPGWAQLAWVLARSDLEVRATFSDWMSSSPRVEGLAS